ncbi:hypothetical protein [Microbacterium sp. cf332]|uniref:hypothetical protein n=1 Tax=Microbacterium sp. cf332 TaxID=1761804 RepID=UPI000B866CE5|nr:hypothetical protein [Microbacterium sp. cf332]
MGEIDQIEDITGQGIDALTEPGARKAKFLIALAYIAKRREDPTFTRSQAEALTLAEVNAITGGDEEE